MHRSQQTIASQLLRAQVTATIVSQLLRAQVTATIVSQLLRALVIATSLTVTACTGHSNQSHSYYLLREQQPVSQLLRAQGAAITHAQLLRVQVTATIVSQLLRAQGLGRSNQSQSYCVHRSQQPLSKLLLAQGAATINFHTVAACVGHINRCPTLMGVARWEQRERRDLVVHTSVDLYYLKSNGFI